MTQFSSLRTTSRRLLRDIRGMTITLEFMLFLPVLVFTMAGGYYIFDAYRERMLVQKAAFTLADLMSRETEALGDTYFDNMFALQGHITRRSVPIAFRASMLRWDEEDEVFSVTDTEVRGVGLEELTNEDVIGYEENLPPLSNGESLLVVTIIHGYSMVNILDDRLIQMTDTVFTRPRFAPTVTFDEPV